MTCILAASLLCIHRMSRLLMNSSHSLAIVIIPGSRKGRQSIALTTWSSQPRCAKSTWKFEPKFPVLQATIRFYFFFFPPLVMFALWVCFRSSALPSRVVLRPQSWPCCSESVGCGGPERLTLTSNPLALAAGLALLNKSTGLCAQKSRPAQLSSGPVVRSPAPQGEPPPHYPMHYWDKRAWHSQRLSLIHRSFSSGYLNIHFNVNACKISNCIDSIMKRFERALIFHLYTYKEHESVIYLQHLFSCCSCQ